eukprot:TRINITY_DN24105_c0_g1_i1.p1 TRINITY_DN24105_c0_g1~~TRINITY_DN24105_c0_g1_i1.p1  ORF type:complete len:452 (+),score=86.28 TRINITY_DN24105_c0_g1_i1:125-1357(+)
MPKKQVGNFILAERLGKGAYGKLWKGYSSAAGGEPVFVRAVQRRKEEDVDRLKREAQFLRRTSHANIVAFRDVKKTVSHLYLFSEYCPCTLAGLLRAPEPLSKATAWRYCAQLAAGLRALHGTAAQAHCDLQPRNILVEPGPGPGPAPDPLLKIANCAFGLRVRSNSYTAPEVLQGEAPKPAADVWSMGVIFLELLEGARPHRGRSFDAQAAAERSEGPSRELLLALLQRNPAKRPCSADLERRVAALAVAATSASLPTVPVSRAGWVRRLWTGFGFWDFCLGMATGAGRAGSTWLDWVRSPPILNSSLWTSCALVAAASPPWSSGRAGRAASRAVAQLRRALRLGSLAKTLLRGAAGGRISKPQPPGLPAARSTINRDPLTSFVVGQLQASHLFRLRTAQLFPRILYSM